MTCKLCKEQRPLVKRSHVIPQWMNGLLPNDGRNFRIISPIDGEYEKTSQAGEYASFVCQACEDLFAGWDEYAATVLRAPSRMTEVGIDFGSYDYGKLKRFYLSVLWRMGAYGRPFLSVDLGPHASPLGRVLLDPDDSALEGYDVVPSWSKHWLSFGIAEPRLFDFDGVLYWKIYMPRFQALINISGLLVLDRTAPWCMRKDADLIMLEDTFEWGEKDAAVRTILANRKRKYADRK